MTEGERERGAGNAADPIAGKAAEGAEAPHLMGVTAEAHHPMGPVAGRGTNM